MGRRSTPKTSVPFFAMVALLIGAGALGFWVYNKPISTPPPAKPVRPAPVDHHPSIKKKNRVEIYVVKIKDNDAYLAPEERTLPADVDPQKGAIEELIAASQDEDQIRIFPHGTKLLEMKVKNGIAYIDFSHEFKDNFSGGSMNEALLLNSIVHTLTQFENIGKVQILVEGEKIESLGGHLDISEPLVGDSTLLETNGDQE